MDKEILKRLKKHLELPKKYKKICDDCGLLEGNLGTPVPKWTYDFYQKQFNKKCGHVVVYGVRLWTEKDLTRKKEQENVH